MVSLLSYSFYTTKLNKSKYNLLKEKAIIIRDFKNKLSEEIFNTKLNDRGYLSKKLSRISIQKEYKYLKPDNISERMYNASILEVITMYNNRKQEVKKPFKKPINFTKLTFSNTNVLRTNLHDNIIGINNNPSSSIKYYLKLSTIKDGKGELLNVPIKINKKYHGSIEEFNTSVSKGAQFFTTYTVQFIGKNKLRFILTKPGIVKEEFQPEIETPIGIDINIKHNMMALSDGTNHYEVKNDKKFLNKYISFLKYLDRKKMNKAKYKNKEKLMSKRDQMKYDQYLRRIKGIYDETISNLLHQLKDEEGYNTIVLEDLGVLPKSFARMGEEFKGFKLSRLSKLLRLAEIKNIFQRLGNKYQMKIVTVNPAYTSQQCPSCNHISKSNRKTQEMFSCVECGYKQNADINASINIMNRYTLYNEVNDFKNHKQIKSFFEDLSLNVTR